MKEIINLPLGESLKRTFLYIFANFNRIMKIISFWMVVMVATDALLSFPSQCREGQDCLGWQSKVSVLVAVIASVSASVALCREIILRNSPAGITFSFGRREIKYLLYNMAIMLMVFAAVFVSGIVIALLTGTSENVFQTPSTLIPFLLMVLTAAVFLSRFCLILPAIAVDNKEMTFSVAFDMTTGNSNKIFFGMFLASLPVVFILLSLTSSLQVWNIENWAAKLLISAAIAFLSLFNALFKACFLAHAYQYFLYFYHKREKESLQERSMLD